MLPVLLAVPLASCSYAVPDLDAFHELWKGGSVEEVTSAIGQGANVKAKGEGGMTALMWAALDSQYPEVMITLLEAGADAGARSKGGETAFDLIQQDPDLDGTDA